MRVEQDAHSSVSRRDRKGTDQVLDEVQTSDEVGAANTSGTVYNKAYVYTGLANCGEKKNKINKISKYM